MQDSTTVLPPGNVSTSSELEARFAYIMSNLIIMMTNHLSSSYFHLYRHWTSTFIDFSWQPPWSKRSEILHIIFFSLLKSSLPHTLVTVPFLLQLCIFHSLSQIWFQLIQPRPKSPSHQQFCRRHLDRALWCDSTREEKSSDPIFHYTIWHIFRMGVHHNQVHSVVQRTSKINVYSGPWSSWPLPGV